ncbi:hypothetical protein CMI37_22405 [Candidatus Pacearchaeota archaeon]|nr:hypothetical protein [Candidatus Pacearchaeota archaeon]|tara:strand:- start:1214 stop:1750 length:537 start_codon:yes stop_codon:yes gene_type:complete
MAESVVDSAVVDSVQARIVPTDLYSLIYPVKEQQSADYGMAQVENWHYEKKMQALIDGRPQQRLQQDRISREVVRAILTGRDWIVLEGKNIPIMTSGATTFPEVAHDELCAHLWGLMGDGLLDMYVRCHGANRWAFGSEYIWKRDEISLVRNSELREALTQMLSPFEAEQPMYVHSER